MNPIEEFNAIKRTSFCKWISATDLKIVEYYGESVVKRYHQFAGSFNVNSIGSFSIDVNVDGFSINNDDLFV